jgi:hypothetical protein
MRDRPFVHFVRVMPADGTPVGLARKLARALVESPSGIGLRNILVALFHYYYNRTLTQMKETLPIQRTMATVPHSYHPVPPSTELYRHLRPLCVLGPPLESKSRSRTQAALFDPRLLRTRPSILSQVLTIPDAAARLQNFHWKAREVASRL